MRKILFIGNSSIINGNFDFSLQNDYNVNFMSTIPKHIETLSITAYDCIILDFGMLKEKSFLLCKSFKVSSSHTIILLLYPTDVPEHILLNGYECGADDYLYPALSSVNILFKKIDLLLAKYNVLTKYEDSRMLLNFDSLTAVIDGSVVAFTPLEFKLLKILSLNPRIVMTRQHLFYSLWDRNGYYVEETSLNSIICRIRQRIDTESHHYIKTIYGIGYMWVPQIK